ncbi:MAG: HAD family hydrolase [candidate division KSB1 bacterium]|nr:HAD family hydrolase [candidate division KSB1 bacterium]
MATSPALKIGRDILVLDPDFPRGEVRFALFDFDGTISLLREGWQRIMEPMMIEMICGDRPPSPEIRTRVREYIEQSTGLQTILQMQKLVEFVREFGLVPEDRILDAWEYKRIYNERLLEPVNARLAMIHRGEKRPSDFLLRGSVELLRALRSRGITLYAASGTDLPDVLREAQELGVAEFFDGGIYGALRTYEECNKEKVLRQILEEHNLSGAELVVFGDGPVEIRLARQFGAIGVGVASNEVRGYGWNRKKVRRLRLAGAHVLVPDFGEYETLLSYLLSR